MEITLNETVKKMNQSLRNEADNHGIPYEEIQDALLVSVDKLDDVFHDNGYIRCERYDDLAIPYALQFGEFDSDKFHEARFKALSKARETFGLKG